jgi:hypothetical protein
MRVLKLHHLIPKPDFSHLTAQPHSFRGYGPRQIATDLQAHFDVYTPLLPQGLVELSLRLVYGTICVAPSLEHLPPSITSLPYMNLVMKPNRTSWGKNQTFERLSDLQMIFPPDFVPNPSLPPLMTAVCNNSSLDIAAVTCSELRFPGPFWFHSSHSFSNLRTLIWSYLNFTVERREVPLATYWSQGGTGRCACDMIQALPRQLTYLDINMTHFEDEDVMLLPDSLTDLRLNVTPFRLSDECLPALPHGLTSLSIISPHAIQGNIYPWPKKLLHLSLSKVGIWGIYSSIKRAAEFFQPKFPKYLQTLQLSCPNLSNFLFLHATPSFLTHLILQSDCLITASIFPMLPETLVRFEHPNLEFYDEDVRHLPRSLRQFYSPNSGVYVTDDSSSEWPPLLREIHIKGCLFTNEGIKKLPKTIEKLFLPHAIHCDQSSLRRCFGSAIQQWNIGGIAGNNFH